MVKGQSRAAEKDRARRRWAAIQRGLETLRAMPALAGMAREVSLCDSGEGAPSDGWAYIAEDGAYGVQRPALVVNTFRDAEAQEWSWVFAHLLVHLGLGHTRPLLAEDGRLTETWPQNDVLPGRSTPWDAALGWFVSSYPLLGARLDLFYRGGRSTRGSCLRHGFTPPLILTICIF